MAVVYFVGILCLFGLAQGGIPRNGNPAIIEDLRRSQPGSRIVAGWEADEGQFPFQVSIRMVSAAGQVFSCGGSIIDHEWVLTAAHCVQQRDSYIVRIGATNLTRPEFITESTRSYIYPTYDVTWPFVQINDIALIQLDISIPYGPLVQPCRLQTSESRDVEYSGDVLTVSGYGLTDDAVNGGASVEHLRWVLLRGISRAECRTWYSSQIIVDSTVCAEYFNDTAQSSCQGDSGGPLTIKDLDGKPTMVGIVSFGSTAGCNSPWPSAYVRPEYFHSWYTEITGINFDWSRDDLNGSDESSQSSEENGESSEENGISSEENGVSSEENGVSSEENGETEGGSDEDVDDVNVVNP